MKFPRGPWKPLKVKSFEIEGMRNFGDKAYPVFIKTGKTYRCVAICNSQTDAKGIESALLIVIRHFKLREKLEDLFNAAIKECGRNER